MDYGVSYIAITLLIMLCFWIFVLWKNSRKLNSDIKQIARQHSLIRHNDQVRDLCRAIHLINPDVSAGTDFLISYDQASKRPVISEWCSEAPRPSQQQIEHALAEVTSSYHEEEYEVMRRAEYPSVEEQLEAAFEARQGDFRRQQEVDEKILKVREKYPRSDICT